MNRHDRIRREVDAHVPEGYRVIRWEAEDDKVTIYIEPLRTERFTFTMPSEEDEDDDG